MKNCKSIQDDLNTYRDKSLGPDRQHEVLQHLQQCSSCREEIRRAEDMEQRLRDEASTWVASKELWPRIKNSAGNEASGYRSKIGKARLHWAAAAMLIVTLSLIGYSQLKKADTTDSLASVLVNEFHTFVISRRNLDYVDTQPAAIRQWFGDKVNFRVPEPVRTTDLELAGGRLCNMFDQRVVSFMYKSSGAWVSLYIMKPITNKAIELADTEMVLHGYGYIGWQNQSLQYFLVGDVPVEQLRQLARSLHSKELLTDILELAPPQFAWGRALEFNGRPLVKKQMVKLSV